MENNDPIRILQIVPNMQMGGLETFIMNLYRNMDRSKVQFDFLVHYQARKFFDDEIDDKGGKIYHFSLRDNNNIIKYIKELNKFYKNHPEYKVIHCHMSSIGFINFLIAKKNGIKVRIAHSHNSSTDSSIKGKVKRIMMLPYKYVSTINYACSTEAGKYLYGNKPFDMIPNAIDPKKFKFDEKNRDNLRKKYNIDKSNILIGHIGRFNIQKNHEFLLDSFSEALKENDNLRLMLIGDGELMPNVKKRIHQLNLQNYVTLTGVVDDSWKYYSAFDIFALPSIFEGLPVVGVEAQCSGVYCLFADNITKDVEISDRIEYLKLNKTVWKNKFINIDTKNRNRNSYFNCINKSDFNINKISKYLEHEYLNLSKK
ncbi:MAG: glycosyltransferase family 1 protein [Bacilli bacterium]|nr:glycosyltransferase family 1 protein [Bacilli bacterium]